MAALRKKKPGAPRAGASRQASGTGEDASIAVGAVDFGDLHRFEPVSWNYGFSRGVPIDRFYIEGFLKKHRARIRGRVLEVEERTYTERYGGRKVTCSDVLHVSAGHPMATVIADLADAPHLPSNQYD